MLKIRLTRTGKKKQASYRVVVADKDAKRDGRIVERIGYYNPLPDPIDYKIEEDRALYWLSVGAQPTDAVRILLEKQGTMERLTRFKAGESLDTLVAEYTGVPVAAVVEAVAAEAVAAEAVAEAVEEVIEEAIEEVEAEIVAEEIEEAIEEAEAEIVAEAVEDAIEEAIEDAEAEAVEEEAE